MKTVSELSNDLGVSKQAIYKKINNQLKVELKNHIKKGAKGIEITEKGVEIIKQSLNEELSTEPKATVENAMIINLMNNVKSLEKQLSIKDNQLSTKDNQINQLQKLNENMQVLMLGLQQQNQLLLEGSENGSKEKRKLFSWFK